MIQILLKSINSEDNIDSDALDIEDGDTFTIPEGFVGELMLEEDETIEVHPIINGEDMFLQMGYSVEDGDELKEGSYELKGNVIKKFFIEMRERLQKWAKETVVAYHQIASRKDVNKAYYTQSDLSLLSEEPELMIVGINPSSDGSYTGQCENKNWSYLYNNNLDENHLLKGNYCKEEGKPSSWDNHRKWGYWNRLKKCLSNTYLKDIIDNDSKIIITNASFFNTKKANEILKEKKELLVETIPYTLKLIKEAKPKHLIFWGGKKCFDCLEGLKKPTEIDFKFKQICGNIYVGELNKKLCIGIPHPTYKTKEELDLVASVLPYFVNVSNYDAIDIDLIKKACAKQIKAYEERNKNGVRHHINEAKIAEQINKKINLSRYEQSGKTNRYKLNGNYGITITSQDKGYIGIRHIEYDKIGYENTQNQDVLSLRESLKNRGYNISGKPWIAHKKFSLFGDNDDCIVKGILDEITELKKLNVFQ